MEIRHFKRGDYVVEYSISPKEGAETILFLHGLGAHLEQFEGQYRFFSDKYQVVTANLSGHGGSTMQSEFSLANCAADLIALMDELKVDKFHQVGNSMGGNVGYELIRNYEERLHSFTTFGTTGVLKIPKISVTILKLLYKLLSPKRVASIAAGAAFTPESKEQIKRIMLKVDKGVTLEILPKLANLNFLDVITGSKVPALIIRGDKDTDINMNIPSTIEAFQRRGNFRLAEMKGAGHFANLDRPDEFNRTLLSFIEG